MSVPAGSVPLAPIWGGAHKGKGNPLEVLAKQFELAVTNVTVSDDKRARAIAAHTEVRELLEADDILKQWGIDTILIGSYARETARHPGKDVDVFLRFKNLDTAASPEKIYGRVAEILVRRYGAKEEGGRVTLQARSVKVDFSAPDERTDLEFSIDAVPAVPWGDDWGIPNRNRHNWTLAEERWIRTNPVAFADESKKLSTSDSSPVVGSRNAYKPVVRLLRQVRHTHLGEDRPGGLYVEVAAYYAWKDGNVAGATWAELTSATLAELARSFAEASVNGLADPILETPLAPALTAEQWSHAAKVFGSLATQAEEALESDECRAAMLWREILGENERGPVLPLPPGCGSNGQRTPVAIAVTQTGSDQARTFAGGR